MSTEDQSRAGEREAASHRRPDRNDGICVSTAGFEMREAHTPSRWRGKERVEERERSKKIIFTLSSPSRPLEVVDFVFVCDRHVSRPSPLRWWKTDVDWTPLLDGSVLIGCQPPDKAKPRSISFINMTGENGRNQMSELWRLPHNPNPSNLEL